LGVGKEGEGGGNRLWGGGKKDVSMEKRFMPKKERTGEPALFAPGGEGFGEEGRGENVTKKGGKRSLLWKKRKGTGGFRYQPRESYGFL